MGKSIAQQYRMRKFRNPIPVVSIRCEEPIMAYRIYPRSQAIRSFLVIIAVMCIWPAITSAETDKVPDEIVNQATSSGKVLVLVGLNVPWTMEGELTENEIGSQRRAIGSALF